MKTTLYLLLSLLLLLSCGKGSNTLSPDLAKAEAVMREQPDSALAVLKRIEDVHSLSKKNQAYYYLLLTEAEDKTYVLTPTDSLIRIAANYYDGQDDVILKTKAWYYMGRVNQELKNTLKAQGYYLKALKTGANITDNALLGRIYNNIGMLYTYQEVYEQAIPYQKRAIETFGLIADSIGQTYALRDLARNYTMLEKSDSAIACYEQAIQLMSRVKIPSVYSELGDLYIKKGDYPKANQYIQLALQQDVRGQTQYPVFLTAGDLYIHLGKLDSAEIYIRKSSESPTLATRAGAIYYLAEIANRQGDWQLSVALNKKYEILRDSLYQQTQTESIRKTAELYNNHQTEEQLSVSLLHIADLKVKCLSAFLIGSILLLFVILARIQLVKKKKLIQKQQFNLEKLRNKQAENEERIVQNNAFIQSLEKLLQENSNDKELIRSQKEALEAENRNLQSQCITKIEQFKISEIYLRFHNKQEWKVKPEEWEELFRATESAYPGFSHRLNEQRLKFTTQELQICYLIKADVRPSLMSLFLNCSSTNVSMIRNRLYEKKYYTKGSAAQFDQFIHAL